jgi:hypothetical protein
MSDFKNYNIEELLISVPLRNYQKKAFKQFQNTGQSNMFYRKNNKIIYIDANQNEFQLVIPLSQKSKSSSLIDKFKKVLRVYTFEFLAPDFYNLNKSILKDSKKYQNIQNSLRLVLYGNDQKMNLSKIKNSLILRYPVYFGEPNIYDYNDKKLQSVLGYSSKNIESKVDKKIRYSISGKAYLKDQTKQIGIIHTWAVNFEKKSTHDYKTFINTNSRLKKKSYQKIISGMIQSLFEGAISLHSNEDQITIRIPLLGLGAFISAINNNEDKNYMKMTFINMIAKWAKVYGKKHPIQIIIMNYGSSRIFQTFLDNCDNVSNVFIDSGPKEGNLFNFKWNKNILHVLVNAWDPRSFIGNGGLNDPTVDGMVVAGYGPGNKLPNSSYLHNVFLSPILLDQSHWINLK